MSANLVNAVCVALKANCCRFALPDEKREDGHARVVLAFWNYEQQQIERGAGIVWIRRQWERCPEPTVLLGFESEEDIRRSSDGSILALNGIVYLELPARALAVQKTIDYAKSLRLGVLDATSRKLNAADFSQALSGWRHTVNNLQNAILGGQAKLARGQLQDIRRQEYAVLADMARDVVTRSRDGFVRIRENSGMPADVVAHQKADEVMAALAMVERTWQKIKEITNTAFKDEQANRVWDQLVDLRTKFDAIQSNVKGLSKYIVSIFEHDSAD
jgi:hypothetical protein